MHVMQKFSNKIILKNPTNIFQAWLSKLISSLISLHRQTTKKLQSGWPGEALLVRHSFLAIALGIFVLTSFREVHKYKNTKLKINLRFPSRVAILWTVDLHAVRRWFFETVRKTKDFRVATRVLRKQFGTRETNSKMMI